MVVKHRVMQNANLIVCSNGGGSALTRPAVCGCAFARPIGGGAITRTAAAQSESVQSQNPQSVSAQSLD